MVVEMECTYCGQKWQETTMNPTSLVNTRCSKCGDKTIRMKDVTKTKVDYYQGCPPFPAKKEKGYYTGFPDDYYGSTD